MQRRPRHELLYRPTRSYSSSRRGLVNRKRIRKRLIIDRVAREIIRLVASVFVRLSVRANRLTLIFGIRVDLDLGSPGIVGQGRRSRSNSVCLFTLSRLNQWCGAG